MHVGFLDVSIPIAQVSRLYIQMFLSYGLYVCIILETAHLRTTFRIFCNITKKTTPKEGSCKMFHISSLIVLFLVVRSRMFWGDKDQISSGQTKGRVKRRGMREKLKMVFFFANSHY